MVRFLKHSIVVGATVVIFGCVASTRAQTDIPASLRTMPLPNEERVAIQKRLDAMFQLLRAEKYAEVYRFLIGAYSGTEKEFVAALRKRATRVASGEKNRYIQDSFRLDGYFTFRDELKHEVIFIDGCLTVRTSDGMSTYSGAVRARRNGTKDWYFETLPAINPTEMGGGGPLPCSAPAAMTK